MIYAPKICKRCGGPEHHASKCDIPACAVRRPDLERLAGRLERNECKTIGADKVLRLIAYARELEAQRRALVGTLRHAMGYPLPERVYKDAEGNWR